jgi:hypothetical protein
MLPPPTYYVLLNLCWVYALVKGGKPERIGVTILIIGTALSILAFSVPSNRFGSVEGGVLLVDLGVLAAFAIIALRVDRFWPIWASACVGLGLLGHLGRWYAGPEISRAAYALTLAFWSYPPIALVAVGVFNHNRRSAREGRVRFPDLIAPRARA